MLGRLIFFDPLRLNFRRSVNTRCLDGQEGSPSERSSIRSRQQSQIESLVKVNVGTQIDRACVLPRVSWHLGIQAGLSFEEDEICNQCICLRCNK